MNERVLNHKWHYKSEGLWTVERGGISILTPWLPSCGTQTTGYVGICGGLSVAGKQSPVFRTKRENFNSPGDQQDAITPAIWLSFECCTMSHRQGSEAPTVFKKWLAGQQAAAKLCVAAVKPGHTARRQIPQMTKQKTSGFFLSLHQGGGKKKSGNNAVTREKQRTCTCVFLGEGKRHS